MWFFLQFVNQTWPTDSHNNYEHIWSELPVFHSLHLLLNLLWKIFASFGFHFCRSRFIRLPSTSFLLISSIIRNLNRNTPNPQPTLCFDLLVFLCLTMLLIFIRFQIITINTLSTWDFLSFWSLSIFYTSYIDQSIWTSINWRPLLNPSANNTLFPSLQHLPCYPEFNYPSIICVSVCGCVCVCVCACWCTWMLQMLRLRRCSERTNFVYDQTPIRFLSWTWELRF